MYVLIVIRLYVDDHVLAEAPCLKIMIRFVVMAKESDIGGVAEALASTAAQ